MSLSTSLRFEINTGGSKSFKEARLRQKERIERDDMMAGRENVARLEKIVNQRAGWNENLEKACWNKTIDYQSKKLQEELKLAAKASLAVRRKALQNLIEKEMDMYEQELHLKGKTFFKQRI